MSDQRPDPRPVSLSVSDISIDVYATPLDGAPPAVVIRTKGATTYSPASWRVIVDHIVVQEGFVPASEAAEDVVPE